MFPLCSFHYKIDEYCTESGINYGVLCGFRGEQEQEKLNKAREVFLDYSSPQRITSPDLCLISLSANKHYLFSIQRKLCSLLFPPLTKVLLFKKKKLFTYSVYLTVLGLSCSTWDRVLGPGTKPRPPALGSLSLTTRPPRKFLKLVFCFCSPPHSSTTLLFYFFLNF